MGTRTAVMAACLLGLCPGAWAQTEHKLNAREIFYSAPPPPAAVKKPTPSQAKAAPKKPAKKDQTLPPPAPVQEARRPAREPGPETRRSGGVPVMNASYASALPLGLRYSILKRTGGEMTEVDPASVFHAGDRIRLQIEVNDPGYLYIVNRGSSGNWKPLFPAPEVANGDNRVLAGRSYEIPAGYTFTFDEQPGEEKLFIVFSRKPVDDLEAMIYSLGDAKPTAAPKREDRTPLLLAMARPIGDDLVGQMRNTYSRDLVIEKVDQSTPGPKKEYAVYAVNPSGSPDSRVVADVTLNHK